jgi:peptide/nickel transport system substrate-binding protein
MKTRNFPGGVPQQDGVSRREFNASMLALGLSGAAAVSLSSTSSLAATPKKGGTFRVGIGAGETADSLDAATSSNEMVQVLGWSLRNNLVEIDHEGNAIPELVEDWEANSDATVWTFKLRPGVEFHNGQTLNVDDVLYSMNWHTREESTSAAKSLLESVASIAADGDRITFELTAGSADFPYVLADKHLHIVPDGTTDFSDGMGTGGYQLVSFEPGVRAHLKRNPNYWKEGRAHFNEVELLSLKDTNARQAALITQEVDAIDKLDVKTVHFLEKQDGIEVTKVQGRQHYTFAMRTDTGPFDNLDVRLALKYAIDRQEILDKVLGGIGALGNDQPISPAYRYYNPDIPQRMYDPDKAKFHLKQAGMTNLRVPLSVADVAFQGAVDAGTLYREHAAKAGIEIDVVREANDGYWSDVWLKKPWYAIVWFGRGTVDWTFSLTYAAGAAWNDTFWEHERFNKLLLEARAELDQEKRRGMYYEMQQILHDDGGAVIPVFAPFLEAHVVGKVRPVTPISPNAPLDGLRIVERWSQA